MKSITNIDDIQKNSQFNNNVVNVDVDVVYTWVNGSDPNLFHSLFNQTNQLFINELSQSCTAAAAAPVCDNHYSYCIHLPIVIVRPKITRTNNFPMKNVIRFEHDNTLSDNNSNYTLLFFSNIKYGLFFIISFFVFFSSSSSSRFLINQKFFVFLFC